MEYYLNYCVVLILIILALNINKLNALQCAKIDFNRPTYNELVSCKDLFLPTFIIKEYNNNLALTPFRDTSTHYLSTQYEGLTCGETVDSFSLDEYTEIDTAIYVTFVNPGAFIEIRIIDLDRGEQVSTWPIEQSTGWMPLKGMIDHSIPNAQVRNNMFFFNRIYNI